MNKVLTIEQKLNELGYIQEQMVSAKRNHIEYFKNCCGLEACITLTEKGWVDFEKCYIYADCVTCQSDIDIIKASFKEFEADLKQLLSFLLGTDKQ